MLQLIIHHFFLCPFLTSLSASGEVDFLHRSLHCKVQGPRAPRIVAHYDMLGQWSAGIGLQSNDYVDPWSVVRGTGASGELRGPLMSAKVRSALAFDEFNPVWNTDAKLSELIRNENWQHGLVLTLTVLPAISLECDLPFVHIWIFCNLCFSLQIKCSSLTFYANPWSMP